MKDDHEATFSEDEEDYQIPEWKEYTYEEFERHVKDVHARRMEKTSDSDGAFFRNILRVKNYFDEFYEEPDSIRKHGSFLVAMTHIEKMKEEYNTELFGIEVSDGFVVSEGLLRAVHWYFCVLPRSEWGKDGDASDKIKEWARKWIRDHPEKTKD